jgi:hypothetical protein
VDVVDVVKKKFSLSLCLQYGGGGKYSHTKEEQAVGLAKDLLAVHVIDEAVSNVDAIATRIRACNELFKHMEVDGSNGTDNSPRSLYMYKATKDKKPEMDALREVAGCKSDLVAKAVKEVKEKYGDIAPKLRSPVNFAAVVEIFNSGGRTERPNHDLKGDTHLRAGQMSIGYGDCIHGAEAPGPGKERITVAIFLTMRLSGNITAVADKNICVNWYTGEQSMVMHRDLETKGEAKYIDERCDEEGNHRGTNGDAAIAHTVLRSNYLVSVARAEGAALAAGAGDGAGSGAGSGGAPTKEVKRETKPGREVIDLSNEDDSIAPAGAGDGAGGSAASGGDQSGFKTPEKAKAERELEASAKKLAASAKKLAASDEKAKKLREENQQLKAEMQRRANEAERDPPLMVIPSGVCDGLGVWIKPGRTLPTTYSLPFGGDDITRREMNQLYPGDDAVAIHVVPFDDDKRYLYDPKWMDRTDGKLAMGVNDGDHEMVLGMPVKRVKSHSNMRFQDTGGMPVLRPMERLHGGANGLELLWSYGDEFWNAGAPATVQNDNLNEAKAAGGQHHQGVGGSDVDLDGFQLDMVRHMVAMPMQY